MDGSGRGGDNCWVGCEVARADLEGEDFFRRLADILLDRVVI